MLNQQLILFLKICENFDVKLVCLLLNLDSDK